MIIEYQSNKVEINHKIRNLESLPRGTGCKFLLCLIAHTGDYVAHSWKRKEPVKIEPGYCLIKF